MASQSESQSGYLTLTETLANLSLFGAIGYWAAGVKGASAGVVLMSARYAYLIWLAIKDKDLAKSEQPPSGAESGAGGDRSNVE